MDIRKGDTVTYEGQTWTVEFIEDCPYGGPTLNLRREARLNDEMSDREYAREMMDAVRLHVFPEDVIKEAE